MTKLPLESWNVVGLRYDDAHPKYTVGPLCAISGCSKIADDAHHIWRRSFLTGDYGWVRLPDGVVIQNLLALCGHHHERITTNVDELQWTGSTFVLLQDGMQVALKESSHPKVWGAVTRATPEDLGHNHVGPGAVERCPTCHRAIPREKDGSEPPRPRKSWTITVPKDERETGADVLDVLLTECAKLFGHADTKQTKYFTLVQALALVNQHGTRMVGDD